MAKKKELTIDDEIAELKRELGVRSRVYPDWTKGPKPRLKPETAEYRVEVMQATLARLEQIKREAEAAKGKQTKLF